MTSSRNPARKWAVATVVFVLVSTAGWSTVAWLLVGQRDDAKQDANTAATQAQRVIDCVRNPDATPRRCAREAEKAAEAIDDLDATAPIVITGSDGQDGQDGQDGADGRDGTPGRPGRPGEPGEDGSDGLDGLLGAAGPAGSPGPPGPQGEQGPAGQDATCDGPFVCEDELLGILADYAPRSWVIDLLHALGCELTGVGSELLTCTITGKP